MNVDKRKSASILLPSQIGGLLGGKNEDGGKKADIYIAPPTFGDSGEANNTSTGFESLVGAANQQRLQAKNQSIII